MESSELCFILMRNILFYSPHISYSFETFRKSSATRFPSVCFKFLKNTSTFLGVADLFVPEIWSFITFYGGFSIIASKLMKPHASFFQDCSLMNINARQYWCQISCLLVECSWRYWVLQQFLKHAIGGMFWILLYFDAQYFILIG